MSLFQHAKYAILQFTGFGEDALHVHIGLLIFFAAHLILRRRFGDWLPVLVLLAICLAGEVMDNSHVEWAGYRSIPLESFQDIGNTMVWPVIFTLLARWRNRKSGKAIAATVDA